MMELVIQVTNVISIAQNAVFTVLYGAGSIWVFVNLRGFLDNFSFLMIYLYAAGFTGNTIQARSLKKVYY
jgi:hypothetical protein